MLAVERIHSSCVELEITSTPVVQWLICWRSATTTDSFIHADEGSAVPILSHAYSLPVVGENTWGDDPDEEARSWYVEDLSKKLQRKWQTANEANVMASVCTMPDDTKLQAVTEQLSDVSEVWDIRKFVTAPACTLKRCFNGSDGNFCHFHSEKLGKLDKKQREILQSFSYEEFVVFILPFSDLDGWSGTLQSFFLCYILLQAEAAKANLSLMPARERCNMSKVFARMNLSYLTGMLCQKAFNVQLAQHALRQCCAA